MVRVELDRKPTLNKKEKKNLIREMYGFTITTTFLETFVTNDY